MVARDRTGPRGLGPRTGRGLGNCKPEFKPSDKEKKEGKEFDDDIDYPKSKYGLGKGKGMGRGLGIGRGYGPRN